MKYIEDIQQLAEYMHNIGDILYFHTDPILKDHVILRPTWGLDAVYKVLDNKEVEKGLGKFSHSTLRDLWSLPVYHGYHVELLRLMQNFQLCYPLPDSKDIYIAPQLLKEELAIYEWDNIDNLQLRYRYPIFMPRGILSRVIVKLYRLIEKQHLVWRSGVILSDQYARAEVLELRGEREIRIRVTGRNKGDLLMRIYHTLEELHLGFQKLRFDRLVPCNCEACSRQKEPFFYELTKLQERLANRKATIECNNPPYTTISIARLLSDFVTYEPNESREDFPAMNFLGTTYLGDHVDYHRVATFGNSDNVFIEPKITSTIGTDESSRKLSDDEKAELRRLAERKLQIERPLYRKAMAIMFLYLIIYISFIPLVWKGLSWLVSHFGGWEKFEPLSWVGSGVCAFIYPLMVWLKPEEFSPCAVRKRLFESWCAKDFIKYGFDLERYQALLARSPS